MPPKNYIIGYQEMPPKITVKLCEEKLFSFKSKLIPKDNLKLK